jgi:uroporphyrinogen III methyltransferase/synthase
VSNIVRAAPAGALDSVKVATIGPVTSATARKLGLTVTVEASDYTAEGVVAAILAFNP